MRVAYCWRDNLPISSGRVRGLRVESLRWDRPKIVSSAGNVNGEHQVGSSKYFWWEGGGMGVETLRWDPLSLFLSLQAAVGSRPPLRQYLFLFTKILSSSLVFLCFLIAKLWRKLLFTEQCSEMKSQILGPVTINWPVAQRIALSLNLILNKEWMLATCGCGWLQNIFWKN